MINRSTYLAKPKINPNSNNNNNQRTSILASTTKQHPNQKPTVQQQNQMITKILDAVGKFDHHNQNLAISREILKAGSSNAFLQILAIFLRSIDGCFKRVDLNTESVLTIVQTFGYRGVINKTILVPLGAPHTWHYCLSILQWFSQLANYAFGFQAVLQQKLFEQDQYSLTLNSFISKNDESIANFIRNHIEHLQGQIATSSYSIESKKMAIRNQHLAQKQLSLVEKQLQKERQLSYRMNQQRMQIEGSIRECDINYISKHQQLVQALEKENSYNQSLSNLKYQITHQELPPDQCEKIKREIRDIKNQLVEFQYAMSEITDQENIFHNQFIEKFIDRSSNLRKMADKLKGSSLVSQSDLKPQLPSLNHLQLNDLIRGSFNQWNLDLQKEARFEEVFKERQFNQYFKRQDQFLSKYQTKFMRQEQEMLGQQRQLQVLDSKEKRYQQSIQHLKESKKTKMSKSSQQMESRNKLQKEINNLNYQIASLNHDFNLKKEEKAHAISQTKQIFAQIKQCTSVMAEADQKRKQILQNKLKKLSQHKLICIQKLLSYKNSLTGVISRNNKKLQQSN